MSNVMQTETLKPHVRYNRLTGEWVLVSPQRALRPWQGKVEDAAEDRPPGSGPNPLCPGAVRNGQRNPDYASTYVFDNDFPALIEDAEVNAANGIPDNVRGDSLLLSLPVSGKCKVICYHPDSSMTMPLMTVEEVERVVDCWITETRLLSHQFGYVQLFENRGELMGCSNAHPHCQIWASSFVPSEVLRENRQQLQYYEQNGRLLLQDYVQHELQVPANESRVVLQNEEWVVVVPFWAVWPFETLLLPKNIIHSLPEVSGRAKRSLAEIMKSLTTKYDNLFTTSFPYSMGVHPAPSGQPDAHWLLHVHYFPPLLRSATIKKFMVGYELLAQPQRDLTPEVGRTAAAGLRRRPLQPGKGIDAL